MGQFRKEDYEEAIRRLQDGLKQLEVSPGCEICGGECWAGSCRFNPLVAFAYCEMAKEQGRSLLEWVVERENNGGTSPTLRKMRTLAEWLSGEKFHMGFFQGPGSVTSPWAERQAEERQHGEDK